MELEAAVSFYLSDMRERLLSLRTVESVSNRLDDFVSVAGRVLLVDVTKHDVHNYFVHLKHERGLADGTLASRKSTLRAFFNFAIKQRWVTYEQNPTQILIDNHQHRYSFDPVHREPADIECITAVLDAIPKYLASSGYSERAVRDALIVSITVDSGGRRKAVWSIRRVDMIKSLDSCRLNRFKQKTYHVISNTGKTGSEYLRFYEDTANLARMYLNIQYTAAVWLFENPQTRRRYRIDYLQSSFKRLCDYADVPVFRFQATRKRNVTDVIEEGKDQKLGQSYANHRDIRSTQSAYNTITRERVDDVAGKLAAERRKKPPDDDIPAEFFGAVPTK